jgi:hypothetical protein
MVAGVAVDLGGFLEGGDGILEPPHLTQREAQSGPQRPPAPPRPDQRAEVTACRGPSALSREST